MRDYFSAPWATSLKVISLLSTILLLAIMWGIPLPSPVPWDVRVAVRILPVVLLAICALYTVRGYEVEKGFLLVRRLLWATRIPLRGLAGVEFRPGSFGWAWRTCGNGGLFSFSGWFYQRPLGAFRALATRATDAVILKFGDRKPIVVTPGDPARFVSAVRAAARPSPE
jgi:hypothetical protein